MSIPSCLLLIVEMQIGRLYDVAFMTKTRLRKIRILVVHNSTVRPFEFIMWSKMTQKYRR